MASSQRQVPELLNEKQSQNGTRVIDEEGNGDRDRPHRHLPCHRSHTSDKEQRRLSPSDSKEFNDITA